MHAGTADMIVVSATPDEALDREWEEHDIARYVRVIAGQEMGTKKEHLGLAAEGKYAADHILMIGDAPGDLKAARGNDALFFPINPGAEDESWERFYHEGVAALPRRHVRRRLRGRPDRRVRDAAARDAAVEEVAKSANQQISQHAIRWT